MTGDIATQGAIGRLHLRYRRALFRQHEKTPGPALQGALRDNRAQRSGP